MALERDSYLTDGTDLYRFDGFLDGQQVAIENARSNKLTVLSTRDFVKMGLKAVKPLRKGTKPRTVAKKSKAKARA